MIYIKDLFKKLQERANKDISIRLFVWPFLFAFILMEIILIIMGTIFSMKITGLDDTAILGGLIGFAGAIIGGILTLMGVRLTIKNNKENVQHQMDLEDKNIRDREVSTYLLNKSEDLLIKIEEFSILVTKSVSLYIRITQTHLILVSLHEQKNYYEEMEVLGELEEVTVEIERYKNTLDSLIEESRNIRTQTIDKLNQAAVAATTVDIEIRKSFGDLKDFVIEKDDKFSSVIFEESSDYVDNLGQEFIEEISEKTNPLQKNISRISIDQLHYLRTGHYPVRKKQDA